MIKNALIFKLAANEALACVEALLVKHKVPYCSVTEIERGVSSPAIMFELKDYKKAPAYIKLASRLVEEGMGKGITFISPLGKAVFLSILQTSTNVGICQESAKEAIGDNYTVVLNNNKYYVFK